MLVYHHLGVWRHGDVTVVRFGDHLILDDLTVERISEELYQVVERSGAEKLLLNFTGVVGITTLMLGKLVMISRKIQAHGGALKLCDLEPEVAEVLRTTKLDQILEIHESEPQALAAFREESENG